MSSNEPPVWLEFEGTLPSDAPASPAISLEAYANTVGLTQTIEMFNWNSGEYEQVDLRASGFNKDSIITVDVSGDVSDYVLGGTETVKSRMGWRASGRILLFPWTASIDQVIWSGK